MKIVINGQQFYDPKLYTVPYKVIKITFFLHHHVITIYYNLQKRIKQNVNVNQETLEHQKVCVIVR